MRGSISFFMIFIFSILTISCSNSLDSNSQTIDKQEKVNQVAKADITIDDKTQIKLNLEGWNYSTKREDMPPEAQKVADMVSDYGGELILFGLSPNGTSGVRIIAEPVDMETTEYFETIRDVNKPSLIESSEGKNTTFGNIKGIVWNYSGNKKNTTFKYLECITKKDKYNLRITMWTTNELFDKNEADFNKVIKSIEL
ncbi:hypothetical protein [Pseudalkalibacillus salsuginis]|uniref:hypothetical protein n=1 Tax=Pseudalkalibacillus salsuginis TaxID=2910972 RepID=UPI001F32E586|nr:hypothetical protein [Pseudalkalibacillus salsuginis]MCF6410682.1 hypothetical protein [Pseudalkalibacillus salsuginis]